MAATMTSPLASRVMGKETAFRGQPVKAPTVRAPLRVARPVACSAQQQSPAVGAIAAAALAAAVSFGQVDAAFADVAGLTPCSESKQFAKREKNELKALDKRLKNYEAGSAPALALQATKERTQKRFANYAGAGLLCGTDGLPHLISDPGLALRFGHAGEVFIPTLGFLYIAGYIGYVGRDYLTQVRAETKPREKEYIIDVPLALKCSGAGLGWPARAITELRNGSLTEDDANITVSPR